MAAWCLDTKCKRRLKEVSLAHFAGSAAALHLAALDAALLVVVAIGQLGVGPDLPGGEEAHMIIYARGAAREDHLHLQVAGATMVDKPSHVACGKTRAELSSEGNCDRRMAGEDENTGLVRKPGMP